MVHGFLYILNNTGSIFLSIWPRAFNYNHGQTSLGQSVHKLYSMRFISYVVKGSAVILQIRVPSPFPTRHNVERSKELCLDGFNTVRGVGGGGRHVQC